MTVALPAAVALAPLLLEHQDLLGATLPEHGGRHARPRQDRRADLEGPAQRRRQDLGERDIGARLSIELLDREQVARRHAVLLPAGLDDGIIHVQLPPRLNPGN